MHATRPEYPRPDNLPSALADRMVTASLSKAVWVNPDGVAFWLNSLDKANAIAAKNGGTVFPPIA